MCRVSTTRSTERYSVNKPLQVDGVDLSHHNPDPDLIKAKAAGLKFLYHKSSEGNTLTDKKYTARRDASLKAGVPFGAYHFARPDFDGLDAITEARYFIKLANPKAGDLIPALDYEVKTLSTPKAHAWCITFQNEVTRLLKERGLTGSHYYKNVHYGPDDFGKSYFALRWVPRYNLDNRRPAAPWDIHQFSGGTPTPGTPSSFTGVGAVDLNNMRPDLLVPDFTLKKLEKAFTYADIRLAHLSLQFNDSELQKRGDIHRVFTRARNRNTAWITGTEAGTGKGGKTTRKLLKEIGPTFGFRVIVPERQDCWVAVNEDFIKQNSVDATYFEEVIPGVGGEYTARGVGSYTFEAIQPVYSSDGKVNYPASKNLGRITVIFSHYLTKGRPGGKLASQRVNVTQNRKLANAIGVHAKKMGAGRNLVFYGGDQNIPDKGLDEYSDTFFNGPLTSCWDELHKWPNTGHGCIDVIASYDKDVRTTCTGARSLNNKQFPLHTDHFYCEAEYKVRL